MSERTKIILYTVAITIICVLGSRNAFPSDYSVKGGPALLDGAPSGESKYFAIRSEQYQFHGVYTALEGGGWVDNGGEGRKSSLITKAQLGVSPGQSNGIFGKVFTGVCAISSTDTMLGGHGQFCTDVGIGFRDRDTYMGVGYMHVSSAGLSRPNKGRDFITLEMGLRF